MKKDYYEILKVNRDASKREIKRAYKKLARKYHPDVSDDSDAEERFKEISEAYAVLSDEKKRKRYDTYGHRGVDQQYSREDIFRNVNFEDIFSEIFGGGSESIFQDLFGFNMEHRSGRQRERDMKAEITVNLEDLISDTKKTLRYRRTKKCDACNGTGAETPEDVKTCDLCGGRGQVKKAQNMGFTQFVTVRPCPRCNGKGKIITKKCKKCNGTGKIRGESTVTVNIPKGVQNGATVKYRGRGEYADSYGDLYVTIRVNPHEYFKRRGDNILYSAEIGFPKAVLGTEITVPTLYGNETVKVPPGTQYGDEIELRRKGLPRLNSTFRKGSQIVRIILKTPTDLRKGEKELYEELLKKN
ncbi:MAG: molecular chaperone DnaJ [Euryarchaeota archaeon]|nr:molecular chaperone DnaJ [Euryarchaeota archaeon]